MIANLCTCTMLTGGARGPTAGCPVHASTDAVMRSPGDSEYQFSDRPMFTPRQLNEILGTYRALIDAYREKRAADGRNGRDWDGSAHEAAEQRIVQLEAILTARGSPLSADAVDPTFANPGNPSTRA